MTCTNGCATMRAVMPRVRCLLRAAVLALVAVALVASPVMAQPKEAPGQPPGLCAPWHKCLAQASLGLVVLYLLFLGAMYMIQRRGFDKVEHRQGNPDGVPTKREG